MIIDCIADLHGYLPKLAGGDLLIVAGDLTARDEPLEYLDFLSWLEDQDYAKKFVVPGNHDGQIYSGVSWVDKYILDRCLDDLDRIRVYGFPHTSWFPNVNPGCDYYMLEKGVMEEAVGLMPNDLDILISHGPPWGILDRKKTKGKHLGCKHLLKYVTQNPPKLHVFGHIHEGYGEKKVGNTHFVNCSIMNGYYEPVNKPIRVVL